VAAGAGWTVGGSGKIELRGGQEKLQPMEELPFAAQGHETGLGAVGATARGAVFFFFELRKPATPTDGNGGSPGGGRRDLGG